MILLMQELIIRVFKLPSGFSDINHVEKRGIQ